MASYEEIGEPQNFLQRIPGCSNFEFFGGPPEKAGTIPPFYRKLSLSIIAFWVCVCPLFAVFAPRLQGETSLQFDAPKGHPSYDAQQAMDAYWSETEHSSIIVLLIKSEGEATVPTDRNPAHPNRVSSWLWNFNQTITSNADAKSMGLQLFQDYYTSPLYRQLISYDNKTAVSTITLNNPGSTGDGTPYYDFVKFLRDYIDDHPLAGFDVAITGQQVLQIDAREGTIKDASKADMIVIPIAFAILATFLQSWRLMIMPCITIGVCIGAGFAAAYPVALAMKVQSTTPQLMMSATLALNIDYNLFLLMRFRENYDQGYGLFENLHLMITHTALETVLGSGSLVSIAFFAMAIIPCEALISTGICCGLTIALVVSVNITLTPSILAVFGTFFAVPVKMPECLRERLPCLRSDENNMEGSIQNQEQQGKEVLDLLKEKQQKSVWFRIGKTVQSYPIVIVCLVLALCSGLYIRFGDLETSLDPLSFVPRNAESAETWRDLKSSGFIPGSFQQYYLVTEWKGSTDGFNASECQEQAVMYALGLQQVITQITTTTGLLGGEPEALLHSFYVGMFSVPVPFPEPGVTGNPRDMGLLEILNTATGGDIDLSMDPPFKCCNGKDCGACAEKTHEAGSSTAFRAESLRDFSYVSNCLSKSRTLPRDECMLEDTTLLPIGILYAILRGWNKFNYLEEPRPAAIAKVNADQNSLNSKRCMQASFHRILTPFEPTGKKASDWMDNMMPLMKQLTKTGEFDVYLAGGNTIPYDFGKIVDDNMYIMLAALVGAVVVVVALLFRSAAIPGIMAITIGYSTASAFGLAYYFFQTTAFSWFYPYLDGDFKDEGVSWSVPPMAISITVALAIDYDIFMLTRIAEYRKVFNNDAAVLKGLYSVGSTICGAGIIMSVAFGGLLFSHVVSLNQFSVILVTSVLLDTFLLSTIFVPACAFLLGGKFWWPSPSEEGPNDEWFFEDLTSGNDPTQADSPRLQVYALHQQEGNGATDYGAVNEPKEGRW